MHSTTSKIMEPLSIIAEKIAGETVLSSNPGGVLRKWRLRFKINQRELAAQLGISSSVISDYEAGRRVPGAEFLRRYIRGLIELDKIRGAQVALFHAKLLWGEQLLDAILDLREYPKPISIQEFAQRIQAQIWVPAQAWIEGHTLIDSLKAITQLSSWDFYRMYGTSPRRGLIFTNLSRGRSPLVAIRISPVKPAAVVLHELRNPDSIAIQIARLEGICLMSCTIPLNQLIQILSSCQDW